MSQDRDFVLELDGQPGSYRMHVSSPAGDDSVFVGLDPSRLGVDLDMLQAQVLASATTSRSMRVPELERPLREVGQALFDAVFQASAGALFLSSRNEVERAGGRLRIVLRLHPPELAVLPWELLFSDHYGGYLCRRSPMVRYVDAPEPVRPLTVTPPLRVLGMTALPGDLAALDADTEQRRLQQLLVPLQDRGLISVDWVPGQSWEAAQDALYAGCQVFHFIGHGGFDPDRGEGVIAFADERGRRQLVGASALADLLSVADPMPRLVVLNSCQTAAGADTDVFSSTAATLVRTVPAVVAMQFAVTDDAAAVFSRAFYQALVRNRGVDEAVRAARIALTGWNPDSLEWVTPVLYLRSRDSCLFDLTYPGASPAGADEQPEPRQEAVLAAYWAARSTGEWEPVITQLAALHRQLPADREVEQAYQYARLAFRYEQGRRAEQEQDWPSAAAHYQAVSDAQPEYRDVAARLAEVSRRRDIAALQEQLRAMFAAGEFQAVVGIADRLAELDPAAADPDGLTIRARRTLEQQTDHITSARFTQTEGPGPDTGPGQYSSQLSDTVTAHISRLVHALTGHTNFVLGVAFSPDGRLLASCGDDKTVRLWDPAAAEHRRTLTGHGGRGPRTGVFLNVFAETALAPMYRAKLAAVFDVAFSPDGRLLASCGGDRTVRLWDPAAAEHRRTLTGHGGSVRGVAFSPDGRLLASCGDDNTVRLWDPAAAEHRRTLTGHGGSVRGVAFSPDGRLLASCGDDNTVRLWDPAAAEHRRTLTGHGGSVRGVAFSPDGRLLASCGDDNTVRLWDPAAAEHRRTLTGHGGSVRGVAFSPDGRLLASCGDDNTVRLWDPAAAEHRRTLTGHGGSVRGVAFSPDGRLLASAGAGNTVWLWDLIPAGR